MYTLLGLSDDCSAEDVKQVRLPISRPVVCASEPAACHADAPMPNDCMDVAPAPVAHVSSKRHYHPRAPAPIPQRRGPTQAYRRLARRAHPDKGGSPAAFAALQTAFETLSDPARRAVYDAHARHAAASGPWRGAGGLAGEEYFEVGDGFHGFGSRPCCPTLFQTPRQDASCDISECSHSPYSAEGGPVVQAVPMCQIPKPQPQLLTPRANHLHTR
jgi:hypothetical protein